MILFFHYHCTYAHDHCKRISCLVLFFSSPPPPLTILLQFFFFKQTDTFIENLHLKLESEKKGEALGIRHHFCRLKSFYLSFCLPFFLSSVLSFPLSRSFFPCYTSSFYYIYLNKFCSTQRYKVMVRAMILAAGAQITEGTSSWYRL